MSSEEQRHKSHMWDSLGNENPPYSEPCSFLLCSHEAADRHFKKRKGAAEMTQQLRALADLMGKEDVCSRVD